LPQVGRQILSLLEKLTAQTSFIAIHHPKSLLHINQL
jgi:hypothetical protein